MHKLLARQIRAARRTDGEVDVDLLIGIIDRAYHELDRERRLNDRAAKLMEDELIAANEQAMREHGAVLATILESAPDGMLVTGKNGVIETANAAAEKQFGARPGALSAKRLSDLLPVKGPEAGTRQANAEERQTGEASAIALNGERFPVEYSMSLLGSGACPKQLWIIRDISERIRSQTEIMNGRLRFRDFAEASSDCFWELDENLANIEATASGKEENAAAVIKVLTRRPHGSSAADDERWQQLHDRLAAHEAFRDLRISVLRDHDREVHISISGKPVFGVGGKFAGYRGTAHDITEEVTARDAARRAERRMIDAMNAAPNAIALLDAAMNFVAGNSTLAALAPEVASYLEPGKPFARFLEKAFTSDDTLQDGPGPGELIHRIIHGGKPYEVQVGDKWLLIAGRVLSDHGAVLTFSDVTAIKERERELAEAKRAAESANKLKSQFLATMSHELRTPLNAILGFSEVIRDQFWGSEPDAWRRYVEYAGSIYASGRHLLSLISEILDLSKIEAGTYFLDLKPLDITELVKETASFVRPAATRAGVEIHTNIPTAPVIFDGDDRALRQIVLNLLSNATKFTPRCGRVDVCLASDGERIRLTVEDTGIGIAECDQAAVFEPFTQVDSSVRRRHEGTGLGLAITKRLVEMHGGTIGLTSQLDVGTRLVVELPVRARLQPGAVLAEAAA